MKVKVKAEPSQFEELEISMTLTMRLRDWRDLMRQFPNQFPSWKAGVLIASAIGHVTRATDALYEGEDVEQ